MTLNILLGFVGMFQLIMIMFYVPLFIVIPIVLCVRRAEKLNFNKILCGILGFFFTYIAVLILYLLPAKKTGF